MSKRRSGSSSRYNLGPTVRTFNVPTSALFYLHSSNVARSRFDKGDEGCADDDTAWDIRFEEVASPTMANGFQGTDLPAHGRFCLDPESGRVLETVLELHHPQVGQRPATDARVEVRFALEPRLGLWVPNEMRDSYTEQGGGRVISAAKYREYLQFNVTVSEDPSLPLEPTGPR